jgi:hypothetical protein
MVVEARKDLESGAEDLQSWAWIMYGIGGTVGAFTGGIITSIWKYGGGARLCYGISSIFPLILGLSGPFIDKSLEENQEEMVKMGICKRLKLVFVELKEGLSIKELYTTLIFQMLLASLVPSFNTYLYQYSVSPLVGLSNFEVAMLTLVANATMIPGTLLY